MRDTDETCKRTISINKKTKFDSIFEYYIKINVILKAEADPGLILGCWKILQRKIEHRNDVICRKIIDSARSKKVQF